jgi:DNA-directed RNA polymerase subunit M/transcription elongation factor TFIIS
MARRARCRCGEILVFRKGPDGYKIRCPSCNSVVRLRRTRSSRKTAASRDDRAAGVAGEQAGLPLAVAEPFEFALQESPELPYAPSSVPPDYRTLVCESCSMIVTTESEHCPGCGGSMSRKITPPRTIASDEPAEDQPAESIELQLLDAGSEKPDATRKILLIAGVSAAVVLIVVGIVLTLWLRH